MELSTRFEDALTFATRLHADQTRKGTTIPYISHLRGAAASVRLVSSAHKLHNGRAILADYRSVGESLWQRFHGGKTGTLWYYRTLVDVLRKTGPAPLVEELERVVSEIETLTAEASA